MRGIAGDSSSLEVPSVSTALLSASSSQSILSREFLSEEQNAPVDQLSLIRLPRSLSRTYDPWKDIYQRGDFLPHRYSKSSTKSKVNRRLGHEQGNDEEGDYYYYYYYDEYTDDDDDLLNRKDNSNPFSRGPDDNSKRRQDKRPYAFEDPFKRPHQQQETVTNSAATTVAASTTQQHQPSLTRRLASAVFSPFSAGLFTVLGIPLILAMAYWLFVVNGPTPVVRAREMTSVFDRIFEKLTLALQQHSNSHST